MKLPLLPLMLAFLLPALVTEAQDLELPRKSPRAAVTHTVGMTEIRIDYSSPAVRDRLIWGELVPWDQVWRAGANEATTISFSHPVVVEGQPLPAGTYAFFMVPRREGEWTAIFNRQDEQWGAYDYNESEDVLQVDIAIDTLCTAEERLQYYLTDQGLDQGRVCLRWERIEACLNFRVPVMDQIRADIEQAITEAPPGRIWMIYAQAADFLGTYDDFLSPALEYAIQSTSRHDHPWNWWLRAQLEARTGDYYNAAISAEKALATGRENPGDQFYQSARPTIEEKLAEWRSQKDRG